MLLLLDMDGTLQPMRVGACGKFQETLLPNVLEMMEFAEDNGVMRVVVTNQSARRDVRDIHAQMDYLHKKLRINSFYWEVEREYRKPEPYMLLNAMEDYEENPHCCIMVGDQDTDRQAAQAAGVRFELASPDGWDRVLNTLHPNLQYWFRAGDYDDYHYTETLEEAAEALLDVNGEFFHHVHFYPYLMPSPNHPHPRRGFEALNFKGCNYVSVWFGLGGTVVRDLWPYEKDWVTQALEGKL